MTKTTYQQELERLRELDSNRVHGKWKRLGPFDKGKTAPIPSNSYVIIKEIEDVKEWQFTICGTVDHQIANKDGDNFAFIEAAPDMINMINLQAEMIKEARKALVKAKDLAEATGYLASYDATVKGGGLEKNTDRAIRLAVNYYDDIDQALTTLSPDREVKTFGIKTEALHSAIIK